MLKLSVCSASLGRDAQPCLCGPRLSRSNREHATNRLPVRQRDAGHQRFVKTIVAWSDVHE
jgi:hypothetical protein